MKTKKTQRTALAVALLGALALPLGVNASAALDNGQFNIRAVNTGDVSIYADAGPSIGVVAPPVSENDKTEATAQTASWQGCNTPSLQGKTGFERIAFSDFAGSFISNNGSQGMIGTSGCSWQAATSSPVMNGGKIGNVAGGPQGHLIVSSDTTTTNTPFAVSSNGRASWYAPTKSNGNSPTGTNLTGFGMRFLESTPVAYVGVNEAGATPKLTISKKERNAANTANVISGTWDAVMDVPGKATALASSQSTTTVVVATEAVKSSDVTGISVYTPTKQQVNVLPGAWSAITWDKEEFFAISKDGKSVATSKDGFSWKTAKSNIGPGWTNVAMGKITDSERFFVATKGGNTVATSKDGVNWLIYTIFAGDKAGTKYTDVAFGKGQFLVLGSSSNGMEIRVIELESVYATE